MGVKNFKAGAETLSRKEKVDDNRFDIAAKLVTAFSKKGLSDAEVSAALNREKDLTI